MNAREQTWPVASLKPNDLGLFDTLGNVCEWSNDQYKGYESRILPLVPTISDNSRCVLRGGAFLHPPYNVRSAYRDVDLALPLPVTRDAGIGFRAARTYP